jgi:hypothetical protein
MVDVVRQRPPTTRLTSFHICKTRGCQCSFRFLMMGGVSPETFWASYKYGIIKFWYIVTSCWIFLYELYYDARISNCEPYFDVCYKHFIALCCHHQVSIFLWNVGTLLSTNTMSHIRKKQFFCIIIVMTSSLSYGVCCFLHLTIL